MPSERNMKVARNILCPPDKPLTDRGIPQVAQALDDAEKALVEALRELCQWGGKKGDCWCSNYPAHSANHSPGCKQARDLLDQYPEPPDAKH